MSRRGRPCLCVAVKCHAYFKDMTSFSTLISLLWSELGWYYFYSRAPHLNNLSSRSDLSREVRGGALSRLFVCLAFFLATKEDMFGTIFIHCLPLQSADSSIEEIGYLHGAHHASCLLRPLLHKGPCEGHTSLLCIQIARLEKAWRVKECDICTWILFVLIALSYKCLLPE